MRICAIVKYPPIQGGVSARSYWMVHALAQAGHQVSVVTNAEEVEDDYRIWIPPEDRPLLEGAYSCGGAVHLVSTRRRQQPVHIPQSPLYTTKLAALATEEIRRRHCEIIFSFYLEPYGVAAYLASMWTGVPYVLQHAGSDRIRLLGDPELTATYREILRRADGVSAPVESLEGFGAPPPLATEHPPGRFLPSCWHNPQILDVDALVTRLAAEGHSWVTNTEPLPPQLPTLAVYGKLGEAKGSFDLVAALGRLHRGGRRFNLLVMGGGRQRTAFLNAVGEAGLGPMTWTLPFLPHWWVPRFLRRATAACFLERNFPVTIHNPGIPTEIRAAGTCLVVSGEIAAKQPPACALRAGENALVVEDPRDTNALAAVLAGAIDDPDAMDRLGAAGQESVITTAEEQLAETTAAVLAAVVAHHHSGSRLTTNGADVLARYMPATTRIANLPIPDATPEGIYQAACERVAWVTKHQDELPKGASEIARYERDRLWLRLDLESSSGQPMFPRRPSTAGNRQVPVRSNWLRLREYRSDIDQTTAALEAGDQPAPDPGTTASFLFHKLPSLDGPIIRINTATARLIELCDGQTSLGTIATRLGVNPDIVRRMVRRLADQHVVQL